MIKPIHNSSTDPSLSASAVQQRSGKAPVSQVGEASPVTANGDRASLAAAPGGTDGPSFDSARVQRLREQIANGQYQVSAKATARGLLQQTRDLQGL